MNEPLQKRTPTATKIRYSSNIRLVGFIIAVAVELFVSLKHHTVGLLSHLILVLDINLKVNIYTHIIHV